MRTELPGRKEGYMKLTCLEWIIVNSNNPVIKNIPQHKIEYIWNAAIKHGLLRLSSENPQISPPCEEKT